MTEETMNETARPVLRFGWVAKGAVFVTIGLLSLELVRRGFASEDADQRGALEALAGAPIGRIGVLVVSIGLLLYAVWQLWAAVIQDGDHGGADGGRPKNAIHQLTRVGWVGLAAVYALIASTGLQIAFTGESNASDGGDGPASPTGLTDRLLDWPGGRVLVGCIGLGTIGVGLYQLWKGVRRDFLDDVETSGIGVARRRMLVVLGTAGFGARALLTATAGWLFIDAALLRDADRAAGLDGSLHALSDAPGGQLLLATTGLGLVAAGLYDMATFRRQRIDDA